MAELKEDMEVRIPEETFGVVKLVTESLIRIRLTTGPAMGETVWLADTDFDGGISYDIGEWVEVAGGGEEQQIEKIIDHNGHMWVVFGDGSSFPFWEIKPVRRDYTMVVMAPQVGVKATPGNMDLGDCDKTAIIMVCRGRTLREACAGVMQENLTVAVFEGSPRLLHGESESQYQARQERYVNEKKQMVRPEAIKS